MRGVVSACEHQAEVSSRTRASIGKRGEAAHKELVDLLEREALGLGHEEVGVDERARAQTAPDEEDARTEVAAVCRSEKEVSRGVRAPVSREVGGEGDSVEPRTSCERENDAPEPTMYGVMTAMMVFQSQFDAVERATPRERIGRGKISPMRTQAPGPQVDAKKKMKMAMKATCTPWRRVSASAQRGRRADSRTHLSVDGADVASEGLAGLVDERLRGNMRHQQRVERKDDQDSARTHLVETDRDADDGREELADHHAERAPDHCVHLERGLALREARARGEVDAQRGRRPNFSTV